MSHTLLLADANRTIHRVIELTFADQPVDVVAVTNGTEAIARIDATPPDLVLADVALPGADGYEVCGHVKQSASLGEIPVVLLTGAFEPVDEARARAAGCDGVLAKPFDPRIVLRRVRELLGRRPAPPAPPAPAGPRPDSAAASLDAYFEQLDANLSTLGKRPAASGEPPASNPDGAVAPEDITLDGAVQSPAPPEAPATSLDEPLREPDELAGGQSLADAFAAFLESERRDAAEVADPVPVVDDRLIEEIVARVVRRLADQDVRDALADVVSQVAERMIREEIARLKASLS